MSITNGSDQMSPTDAIFIRPIDGAIIVIAVSLVDKLRPDDPVGAFAMHLVCRIWGTLAAGLFGNLASYNQFICELTGVRAYTLCCTTSTFTILIVL